jgi:hypothetical protein
MNQTGRRRDRRSDQAEERVASNAPPSPHVARVLALQRSAGNRQVAGLLSRRSLQREEVQGHANWAGQRHHPHYAFDFSGENHQTYDFDKWFSGKTGTPAAYASTLTKDAVQAILDGYDGNGSILDRIVAQLVGTGSMGQPDPAQFSEKDYSQQGKYDVQAGVAGALGGPEFATHFLALQHNIGVRVADMPNNVVSSLRIKTTPTTPASKLAPKGGTLDYALDWLPLLTDARMLVKDKLKTAPPEKDDIPQATAAIVAATGNFATLRDFGIIDKTTGKYKTKGKSGKTKADGATHEVMAETPGGKVTFNFGLNHIRAIIYVEWRAAYELLQAANAQNAQQATAVVQQLVGVQ